MIRHRIGFPDMAPFNQGFSPDHQKAIGVTILDCASPNTNKGHKIMGHDVVYKEQILPIAQDPFENVTTVLICQNVLLRAGLRHILSGTRFTPADDVSEDMKGLRAFADKVPVLVVICEAWTPEQYAASIQELKAHCPSARVVLLTDTMDPDTVPQLCRSGVDGFCPTNMERPTLVKAFEMVMLGETFIPASIGLALLDQMRRGTGGRPRLCGRHTRQRHPQAPEQAVGARSPDLALPHARVVEQGDRAGTRCCGSDGEGAYQGDPAQGEGEQQDTGCHVGGRAFAAPHRTARPKPQGNKNICRVPPAPDPARGARHPSSGMAPYLYGSSPSGELRISRIGR